MSWDAVPILSQGKSFVELCQGDVDAAICTQRHFSCQCPIISQLRSLLEVTYNPGAAWRSQIEFLFNCADVVGAPASDAVAQWLGHVTSEPHLASGSAMVDVQRGPPRIISSQWSCYHCFDVDPSQNAAVMLAEDLVGCMRYAESHGYGGFVVFGGLAYFRKAPGAELKGRLCRRVGLDIDVYVYKRRPHGGRQRKSFNNAKARDATCLVSSMEEPTLKVVGPLSLPSVVEPVCVATRDSQVDTCISAISTEVPTADAVNTTGTTVEYSGIDTEQRAYGSSPSLSSTDAPIRSYLVVKSTFLHYIITDAEDVPRRRCHSI